MRVSEEQLAAVAKEVLETMAFAFEMTGEEPGRSNDLLRAVVDFRGSFHGSVSLTLPRSMLPDIVINMLGVGEEVIPPEQDQRDALGELANVICGNLVQALAGPQPVFDLAAPRIDVPTHGPDALKLHGDVTRTRISLENGWAEVTLVLRPEGDATSQASLAGIRAPDAR